MSIWILLIGIILGGLKLAEIDPVAKLSWWWISIPFIVVVVIWEVLTPLLGLDKKKEHEAEAKAKEVRMAKNRSCRPGVDM